MDPEIPTWTGAVTLEAHVSRHWHLGPLRLWAERRRGGIKLAAARSSDPFEESLSIAEEGIPEAEFLDAAGEALVLERWIPMSGREGALSLELHALLADRPIVTKPEMQVYVPADDHADVYLTSPLWVGLSYDGARLLEIPTWRPSDTWFGPSTVSGTLAYAGRTRLRSRVEELSPTPVRALTQTRIVNQTRRAIELEGIALPLPSMRLYRTENGRLWTESVEVRCDRMGRSEVRVEAPSAELTGSFRVLGERRIQPDANGLVRAFSALFSGGLR